MWFVLTLSTVFTSCTGRVADKFQHDAVVVYGEDHQDLARNQLRPRLRDLGYDVLEELARPGRREWIQS